MRAKANPTAVCLPERNVGGKAGKAQSKSRGFARQRWGGCGQRLAGRNWPSCLSVAVANRTFRAGSSDCAPNASSATKDPLSVEEAVNWSRGTGILPVGLAGFQPAGHLQVGSCIPYRQDACAPHRRKSAGSCPTSNSAQRLGCLRMTEWETNLANSQSRSSRSGA